MTGTEESLADARAARGAVCLRWARRFLPYSVCMMSNLHAGVVTRNSVYAWKYIYIYIYIYIANGCWRIDKGDPPLPSRSC